MQGIGPRANFNSKKNSSEPFAPFFTVAPFALISLNLSSKRFSECDGADNKLVGTICYIYLHSNDGQWAKGFDKCLAIGAVFGGYWDQTKHTTIYEWVRSSGGDKFYINVKGEDYPHLVQALDSNSCNIVSPPSTNQSDGIWNLGKKLWKTKDGNEKWHVHAKGKL